MKFCEDRRKINIFLKFKLLIVDVKKLIFILNIMR